MLCGKYNKIYRYFYLNFEKKIFSNITQLQYTSIDEYIKYIKENKMAIRLYDANYIHRRLDTEKRMLDLFVKKGGIPKIKSPYYFTLGKCDEWFYRRKNSFGSVEFLLNEFDSSVVSFTYGDSIPTFMPEFNDGKEYRSNVYTFQEICQLIDKYGMPNAWNTYERFGPENYIEVQIWSDEYTSQFNSEIAKLDSIGTSELTSRMIMANPNIAQDAINQKSANYYLKKCVFHNNWHWFCNLILRTNAEVFSTDIIHGLAHAQKCALMAFALATELDLCLPDFKTLVYAAFFHDLGRKYYENGKSHGVISSEKIDAFIHKDDTIHRSKLKDAVSKHDYHLVNDDNAFLIWLRDIDSLDYLRLGIGKYETRYLKTNAAKRMVRFAIELNVLMYLDAQFIDKLIRR